MKIILEIPELEAIVKENIASKYPNQDAKVTVQNKRNGVEVTVVLTEKLAEKEVEDWVDDKDYIDDDYYVDEEPTETISEDIEV